MPHGGSRPGAGAPKGNLNGLKSGRYSPRVRAVIYALMQDPVARSVLLGLGRRNALRDGRIRETVIDALRILGERPVALNFRRRITTALDDAARDDAANRHQNSVADYEHASNRDALTGRPLRRAPRRRPPLDPVRKERLRNAIYLHLQSLDAEIGCGPPAGGALDESPAPLLPLHDVERARPKAGGEVRRAPPLDVARKMRLRNTILRHLQSLDRGGPQ
ncbi:MAG: hypothetical protein WEC75_08615 [Dehalococcoidia bacterium]